MNENSLSACYITGSELLFILLQLIIVSFVELKGKTKICSYIFNILSVVENIKLINAWPIVYI